MTTIIQQQKLSTCPVSGLRCNPTNCPNWHRVIQVDSDGVAYANRPLGFCAA